MCTLLLLVLVHTSFASVLNDPKESRQQSLLWPPSGEVSPCNDFYQYACTDQRQVNLGRGNKSVGSNYLNLAKQAVEDALVKAFSDNSSLHFGYERSWSNARKFYQSCLQKQSQNAVSDVKRIIRSVLDLPEVTDTWREANFDWVQVVSTLRRYGIQAIIHESVGPDWKDSRLPRVYFVAPKFDFVHKEDLLGTSRNSDEFVFFYKRYIKLSMSKLGMKIRKAREASEKIVAFETKLAEIVPEESDIEPPEPISVAMLQRRIHNIDWFKYLKGVLGDFDPDETQVIIHEDYYRKLSTVVQQADVRTVAQYLLFKFMFKFKAVIDEEHDVQGCLRDTIQKMSASVGKLYIKTALAPEVKQSATHLVDGVKTALAEVLGESSWLDQSTKNSALGKLSAMRSIVGYPEELLSYAKEDSVILTDDYYENCLRLGTQASEIEHEQLKTGLQPWLPSPVDTNAYYKVTKNTIFIPAGLLVPPIFDISRSSLQNYAILGSIVGHELTHAFDFEGRNYNAKGSVENWWTTKSLIAYYSHVECILSQYNNISTKESRRTIGGFGSISENVADKGGVQVSYRAYNNWKQMNKDSQVDSIRPESNATSEQFFFLSFARLWCNSFDEAGNESSSHSSNKFRVLNSLSGMQSFVDAFHCRSGSVMHPVRSCRLW